MKTEHEIDLESYKKLYDDVARIVGIYEYPNGNKIRLMLTVQLVDGKFRNCSYPKAIYEIHLGRKLKFPDETVDHINNNPMDNRIENLQILSLSENAKKAHADGICYRTPKGTKVNFDANGDSSGKSLISNDDVLKYRRLFSNGCSKYEIISETGLSRRTVENFLFGVSYRNVPEVCIRRREKK